VPSIIIVANDKKERARSTAPLRNIKTKTKTKININGFNQITLNSISP
jgi:hypothetical protein